jgi:1,4-alpha-glucan branching enzyme
MNQLSAAQQLQTTTLITADDLCLFKTGSHFHLYEKLGSQPITINNVEGTYFAIWAPNAGEVLVIGDFNSWQDQGFTLTLKANSGIWEGFIPSLKKGDIYKYRIINHQTGYTVDKADPFARLQELPPSTASVIWDSEYHWNDQSWMDKRHRKQTLDAPIAIYEVHLGSWMRVPEEENRFLTYREIAVKLAEYVKQIGFTHIELMPITEHPFYGSWGYQTTGYFAPTSRYGTPQDFMYLVDYLHQQDIGVILDWVPSHLPNDQHGLSFFDGTHLYEQTDPDQGFHADWQSSIFNYGRQEVRSFLISSAFFWLEKCHIDGLRVCGVASMLYLDYSRQDREWIPNQKGGRENEEAIAFLQRFNQAVSQHFPDVQTIAEESNTWSKVSHPVSEGGLGFGLKWDMDWMHDTLSYMSRDPLYRRHNHHQLTFRILYAFSENFVLPLSHDQVVHGKTSLISKMPGDEWQKFANLRLLLGYMYAQPAKKLLFMGGEFGQWQEWNYECSLDWHLLNSSINIGVQKWVSDLNKSYRCELALHQLDCDRQGFSWIDCNDSEQSVVSFIRKDISGEQVVLVVCNFTPVPRYNYRVGVPTGGFWSEILNSDALDYCGSGVGNFGGVVAEPIAQHNQRYSVNLILPPLAIAFFKGD